MQTAPVPLAILLMASLWAGPQGPDPVLRGVVADGEGRPVVAAHVALHSSDRVLRTVTTGQDGEFRFSGDIVLQAGTLTVERLGFVSVERSLPVESDWIEVIMEPDPLRVTGFTVDAGGDICSSREDPRARQTWEVLGDRYTLVPDTVGMATYLLSASGEVDEEGVGVTGDGSLEQGQRGSAPLLRFGWFRRIEQTGYAFRVRRTSSQGSYDSWSYAPLEAELAFHFLSPLFGRLHRFHFPPGKESEVLHFCPRDPDRPSVEGRIRLTDAGGLAEVEWLHRTPDPEERSGGRVYFSASRSSNAGEPYLVPTEGLSWRKHPGGEFIQRYQRYEGWIFAPGDSVPFLPKRSSAPRDP